VGALNFIKLSKIISIVLPLSHMEKKRELMVAVDLGSDVMSFRLIEKDCKTLAYIAEYRMLTVSQIAAMFGKKKQVARRRLRILEEKGLIEVVGYEFGRGRGRPEKSIGLTKHGIDLLKYKGLLKQDILYEKVLADCLFCVDHQLLLNWFRIHLNQIEKVLSRVSAKFFAYNSPFLPKGSKDCMFITDYSPVPGSGIQGVKFTPDGVFGIKDSVADKTCLYFLEVDRGTETMASPKRDMSDVRQKIVNYQWYFQSGGYKRYEEAFKGKLYGFRLLFLTSTYGRLVALCKLTQEMFPREFVWLTECNRIFPDGVSAEIWAIGGDIHAPQGSILGSLCCKAPLS
jgi:DNA-binding MarR family transcriptional regulator